jgi:tRNA threonylcarbamoyladenosine biosynthesis protein TsaE
MRINSHSVKNTLHLGGLIARELLPGDIICLFGDLGSGKTVLTKGIAAGLGIDEQEVNSPSFVLIREYNQGRIPLYHFDFYRIDAAREISLIGYEEYFYGQGVCVVEWAQRLDGLLPPEYLKIELAAKGGTQRSLVFSALGQRYRKILEKIDAHISR